MRLHLHNSLLSTTTAGDGCSREEETLAGVYPWMGRESRSWRSYSAQHIRLHSMATVSQIPELFPFSRFPIGILLFCLFLCLYPPALLLFQFTGNLGSYDFGTNGRHDGRFWQGFTIRPSPSRRGCDHASYVPMHVSYALTLTNFTNGERRGAAVVVFGRVTVKARFH